MSDMGSRRIGSGLIWKLLERFGVQGAQFILQIFLARILAPEHYGVLTLMLVFTTLANVFVQSGFNTALVQNKDVTDEDYSSVLWVSLGIAAVLYGIIFAAAPLIAVFYEAPEIVAPLRVLALMLLPGALNSVQLAKISRDMRFNMVFISSISATVVSGVAGIVVAAMGGGLWALVVQSLLNVTVSCVVMRFTSRLKLRFVCNFRRVLVLFSYGWKLLVSALLDTLYQDIRSLVIGKKYDNGTLGYYNKGKSFPQLLINSVNGAIQSVMLPAMAGEQDDRKKVKHLMRGAVTMSSYLMFPMMAGLAAVAEPTVRLLLTEKWLPCVPYLQIYCFTFAFYPVHTSNLQAINAVGRSDIFLKLEIAKKTLGIAMLTVAVFCFDSPIAIAMTGAISAVTSSFINAFPGKKLIDYSYFEQMRDILPSMLLSLGMFAAVYFLGNALAALGVHDLLVLITQIAAGVAIYVGVSAALRFDEYKMAIGLIKSLLRKKT